jgi:chromosome segregation ATPase
MALTLNLDGLSFYIINSDITSRSRLREVIKASVYKANSEFVLSIKEAQDSLDKLKDYDVVFISFGFGGTVISDLIKQAKNALGIKCPSFIVTLEKQFQNTSTSVTSLFLDGASGFIAEPYSSAELTTLLSAVKENREKLDDFERQKRISRFLLLESVNRIEQLSSSLIAGKDPSIIVKKELKNISENLENIYNQDPGLYIKELIDVFENVPTPVSNLSVARKKRIAKKKSPQHPGVIIQSIMNERNLTIERLIPSLKVEVDEFQSLLNCTQSVDDKF